MSPLARDDVLLAAKRQFSYDDCEQLFVIEDTGTGSSRATYLIDFSSSADSASDPSRYIRAFGHSLIQDLIGSPIGRTIPVGQTWTALGAINANVALASGTGSANAQPLDSDPSSLHRCLRALRMRPNRLTSTRIAALERQLETLLNEEEGEVEGPGASEPSLYGLIDFLSEHNTLAHPSLSITRNGYFAASWSPRKRAKLTIMFGPGGNYEWIAIDLDATPPVHDKGPLANLPDKFANWMHT